MSDNPVESVTMSGDPDAGLCECPKSKRVKHMEQRIEGCQAAFVLMPTYIAEKIPPLYAQDGKGEDAIVFVKWFTPGSSYTWYVTEFDPTDGQCFGWIHTPDFPELGYFDLGEIEDVRYGPGGALRVERDLWFDPITLRQVKERQT